MKVSDLMTAGPGCCASGDSLGAAAEIMRERDCGAVPVVDADMEIVGIITDRDICLALAAGNKKASELKVGDTASRDVTACRPRDKIGRVLKVMKKKRVRRLPVIDADKKLVGIITIGDIILGSGKDKSLRKKAFSALKEISHPRSIVLHEIAQVKVGKTN
jgi:CBS domain-containing protein